MVRQAHAPPGDPLAARAALAVARDRQRAKQRQAARRSSRREDGATWGGDENADAAEGARGDREDPPNGDPTGPLEDEPAGRPNGDPSGSREVTSGAPAGAPNGDDALDDAALRAGAPSEATGRSDTGRRGPSSGSPGIPSASDLDDAEAAELARLAEREPATVPPDPARPDSEGVPADAGGRGRLRRFLAFCVSCWTELKRVQWPTRAQLIPLTGVVLGFCVIAGGYLGILDFVFSRLIRAIL